MLMKHALLVLPAMLREVNAVAAPLGPVDPTITAAPILPRQAGANFIGWIEISSSWYNQSCDASLTWYQSGNYAQCCPATNAKCNAATACISSNGGAYQIYPFANTTITTACTENYNNKAYSICNTAFIFESFGDSSPKTDIVCGASSVNWSYFRKIPASLTQASSSIPSSAGLAPGSAASVTAAPTQSGSSGSKAWIAGAVVGPIVGIALIAGIVFFLLRRRKSRSTLPQTGSATMGGAPAGVGGGYTDAKPQMATTDPEAHMSYYGQPSSATQPAQPFNGSTSPTPQYAQQYSGPTSPQPGAAYGSDVKYGHTAHDSHPGAAELGGASSPATGVGPGSHVHSTELPAGTSSTH